MNDQFQQEIAAAMPFVSRAIVALSERHRMFFDATKAIDKLGLPQHPVEDALARAVHWFRTKGYIKAAA